MHWVLVAQVQVWLAVSHVPFPAQSLSLQHSLVQVAQVLVEGSQYCFVAVHWSLVAHAHSWVVALQVPRPVQSVAVQQA